MPIDNTRVWCKGSIWAIIAIAKICGIGVMFLSISGCGSEGSQRGSVIVEGKVTLKGAPLKSGQIQFIPLSAKQGSPVKAAIEDGKYRAEGLSLGSYSVTFSATRSAGKMRTEHGMQIPETENLIPAKYAAGIQISISGDKESKDFNL
jgi:hypothetical protein